MRTRYIVADQSDIIALMDLTSSLLHCDPSEEDKQRAHDSVETVRELIVNGASPFIAYRNEILGHYSTARRLQDLTLHLWNSGNPLRLSDLLMNADTRHRLIALEMIASYSSLGENDPDFMRLADEIRDMREAEKARAAEQPLESAYA
jgi:hypothetical protein